MNNAQMEDPDRVQLFDTWAQRYDASLASTDGDFPFDGYEHILNEVATLAEVRPGMRILDLGIGTGNLAQRFVQQGCEVWGVDFSTEMLAKARVKLPHVHLVQADLLIDWPADIQPPFDRIVSAYVLHEFTLEHKIDVLRRAIPYLVPGGVILVADIALPTVAIREATIQRIYGDSWDEDEWYWAADEAIAAGENVGLHLEYRQMSRYGGIFVGRTSAEN
ncbi:MAG: class I SAM-dependent methyltransferase [Anaerolineae bacterium]|nr:class I SAM-dependent methyltransferase [Anaerolineae bacterium]